MYYKAVGGIYPVGQKLFWYAGYYLLFLNRRCESPVVAVKQSFVNAKNLTRIERSNHDLLTIN